MEEYIAADPITFEHHALFKKLQSLSLDWRLNDPFASLVSSILKILLIFIVHIICIYLQPSGLVHTRASLCPRRILCKVKSLVLMLNSYNLSFSHSLIFSSQSYIPDTGCVVASATSVTWKTCWRSARSTCSSTPPSSTSATPTVPVMFMATGQWDWKLDIFFSQYKQCSRWVFASQHWSEIGKGVNILTSLCLFSAKERYVRVWWLLRQNPSLKSFLERDGYKEAFPGHLS